MKNTIMINVDKKNIMHKDYRDLWISNENNVDTLNIVLNKEVITENATPYLEIKFPDSTKKFIEMYKISASEAEIIIKNSLLKQEGYLILQFVLRSENNTVFKSEIFSLRVKEAINATETIEQEYPNILNEIKKMQEDIKNLGDADFTEVNKKIEEIELKLKDFSGYDDTEIREELNIIKQTIEKTKKEQQEEIFNNKNKIIELENKAGTKVNLNIDTTDYVMTLDLLNSNDEVLSSKNIDFPLESMVVDGRFENSNIILTLQNGNEVSFSVGSLINGLVSQQDFNLFAENINQKLKDLKLNDVSIKLAENIKIYFEPTYGESHAGWGKCYYYKKGSKVTLHIGINLKTSSRVKIFTMPEGFRPGGTIPVWGGGADGAVPDQSFAEIFSNGEIYIKSPSKFALMLVEYDVFEETAEIATMNLNNIESNILTRFSKNTESEEI